MMTLRARGSTMLWCLVCLWLLASHAPAQLKPRSAKLEYYRVFYPANLPQAELKELLAGHRPLATAEFEAMLAAVNAAPSGPGGANVRLLEATYTARLDEADLVDGTAQLLVQHQLAAEAMLGLDPCSLAISKPRWKHELASTARLGMDAGGKLAVVVEPTVISEDGTPSPADSANTTPALESTELQFDWSLRGARASSGALMFDVQTPACPTTRLQLDLPANVTPVVNHGLVTELTEPRAGKNAADDEELDEDEFDESEPRRHWLIELGGRTRTTLSIVTKELLEQRQRYVLLRQAVVYDLTAEALEASFDLNLDIYHEPLRQLTLEMDPALRITSVRLGDTPLTWTIAPGVAGNKQRVVIEFAEPLSGHERQLRVATLARIERQQTWRLPGLRVEGVVWQEGSLTLQVPEDLELCALTPHAARQTKAVAATAMRTLEQHQFQSLAADAGLEIFVRDRQARIECEEGLTLKWDGPHLTGRLVSQIFARQGAAYQLVGNLPPGWVVDSVETEPASALDDWTVTGGTEQESQLTVRLAQPVTTQQSLQLRVHAHRRAPARNERLQPDEYRLADWQQVKRLRRLIAVQTETQQQLALVGDAGLVRLDPKTLTPTEQRLIDAPASRLVFVEASATPAFALALRSESPRFAAETSTTFVLGADLLSESHSIRIVPDGTPISRVLVRFTPALPREVTWKLEENSGAEITARPLATANGELWELLLPRPQNSPLTVTAERQTNLRPGDALRETPLVVVADAETQRGQITIEVADGVSPVVEQQGLKPVLLSEATSATRARFLYQPAQDQRLLIGHAPAEARPAPLWAWSRQMIGRVDTTGQRICTVSYYLENTGASQWLLRLPPGARLRQARVNGARLTNLAAPETELAIPLPLGEQYLLVEVEYSLPPRELGFVEEVTLPAPTTTIPVLAQETQVWLSPAFELTETVDRQLDWRSRLLGPLVRREAGPTSLFSVETWQQPFRGQRATSTERRWAANCRDVWQQIVSEGPATWGEAVERYDRLASDAPQFLPALEIDAAALASLNISAETELAAPERASPSLLFAQHHLALVLDQQTVRLTSRLRASGAPYERFDPIITIAVEPDAGAQARGSTVADWLTRPELPRWPWQAGEPSLWTDLDAADWTAHTFAGHGDEIRVTISRIYDVRALAWGVFLASAGLGAWLVSRRWFVYLVLVAAAAIVALWLPAAFAPLATAAFLGALAGGLAALAWRPLRHARSAVVTTSPVSESRLPVAVGGVILLIGVAWWNGSSAQEPRGTPAPASETYRVLVPTDEDRKPAGDYVYLPRAFYDALARQAKNANAIPQGWIIYEATYRGRVQTATTGKLQFADLVASYDVEVFQPNTVVTIGLGRENVNLLDDRVNLEGETARIEWLENGTGFTLPIARPGRYRVDVTLRPTARIVGAREEVDLRLPRVARSQFLLRAPAAVAGLQITGGQGHTAQAEAGSWSVDLGPTSRLTVYWPTGETTDAPKSEVEVAQQLWWKLREGSVVLESRWQFKSSGDPLSEVRLIADPRLRLLPLAADQPVAEHSVREGDVQAIRLGLKEPYQREVTITASFSLTGAAGIGRLSLPRLEAVADRTTRRWLGVSTYGVLEASVDPAQRVETLTPQEFATTWGAMEPPAQAFRISEQSQPLVLQVSPKPAQAVARQALTFALEPARVRAELEAVISARDGAIYQHQIQLPDDWEIDEALLYEGESTARKLRVACTNDGVYTLFLPQGVSGEHRLTMRALGPTTPHATWTLPAISLQSATSEPPLVFVERFGPLVATVTSHAGYEPLADAPPAVTNDSLHRVAVLRPLPGAAQRAIEVKTEPSSTRLNATQLISIVRRGDAWQAVVDLALEATGGSVESLRFEIPSDVGEIRLDTPASLQVSAVAGQNRPHLTARLAEPRSGKFMVRLIAPLSAAVADRLQAPDIRLLDAESLRVYVVLPAQIDEQKLAWETRGLQAASLPEGLREPAPDSIVFHAPVGRFQAAVKRFERVAGVPQVRLADVTVALPESGHGLGVISFDLEPAGLAACEVRVPPMQRLIQATVAGKPAVMQPLEHNRYRLLLQHEQLSQHIEVLFALSPDESTTARTQQLVTPTLADIPVERTLWTVISHRQAPVYLQNREALIDQPRQTTFRLKNAEAQLAHAASHALEGDAEQIAAWFVDWSHRQMRLQALVAREPQDGEGQVSTLRSDWAMLQTEAQALAQQWNLVESTENSLAASTSVQQLSDLIAMERDGTEHIERAMLPGAPASLEVERHNARPAFVLPRALGALLVVLSFCAVTLLLRWPAVGEFVKQAPQLLGVVLGIAWWFWLTPPLVGIAIAVVFALAALRSPWPRTPAISSSLLSSSTAPSRNR